MLNNYMGILCLNEKESHIKSLTQNRPLASIPLGGRYRIIDFILSEAKKEESIFIGDQIFTDIIGANRMHMYSILVEPINQKDIFLTWIKRPIENYIKNKYLEKTE